MARRGTNVTARPTGPSSIEALPINGQHRHHQRSEKGARVIAAHGLAHVPEGTKGKVVLVNGLSWIRYWVRFDNGVTIGLDQPEPTSPRRTSGSAS